jgi:hypothetical protein
MKALIIVLQFLLWLPFTTAIPAAPLPTPAAPAGNHKADTPSTSHTKGEKNSTPPASGEILPAPVAKGGIAPTMGGHQAVKDTLPAEYKGAVTVDLSGLSALFHYAGGDMSQFEKSQEKLAAMAKAGNNLESVSGGFWDDINGSDETFQTSKTDETSKISQTDNTSKTSKTARHISNGDITEGDFINNASIARRAVPARFTDCLRSSKLIYYTEGQGLYAEYADTYN